MSFLLDDTVVVNEDDERNELPIPLDTIHSILPDKRDFAFNDKVSWDLAQRSRDMKRASSAERPMVDASMWYVREWGTTFRHTTPQLTGNLSQMAEVPGGLIQVEVRNDNLRLRWRLFGATNYDFHMVARVKSESYIAKDAAMWRQMGMEQGMSRVRRHQCR